MRHAAAHLQRNLGHLLQVSGNPEVKEDNPPIRYKKGVFGLDVAVDHGAVLQNLECGEQFSDDPNRFFKAELHLALQPLTEGFARKELFVDAEHFLLVKGHDLRVMNPSEMRVMQGLCDRQFAQRPLEAFWRTRLDELEGNVPYGRRVRKEDDFLPAPGNFTPDLEVTEEPLDRGRLGIEAGPRSL